MSDWIRADWAAPAHIVAGTTLRDMPSDALPVAGRPCWLQQVHGAHVVSAGPFESPPEADACVKGADAFLCVVRTADCLPVLFCSADGEHFGAAHAGWRGLAAGVLENTLVRLDVDPGQLLAWLGPAISQASFEVGDEVREAFLDHDPAAGDCFLANARGRWQANLYALARQRLAKAGVATVSGGGFCTFLDQRRFYSHRRSADRGRMLSFVGIASP